MTSDAATIADNLLARYARKRRCFALGDYGVKGAGKALLRPVEFAMLPVTSKQAQVVWTVVASVSVYMVDNFLGAECAPNETPHDNAVFWMPLIAHANVHIAPVSAVVYPHTTSPALRAAVLAATVLHLTEMRLESFAAIRTDAM